MPNRLARSTSPYLLQHKDNPVDWWEWSDEAFAAAAERDVPVLLSVGYSACHWCHVMAHESFEDETTAEEMNRQFVNIKVDREERPDVDSIYMEAVQAMTGRGGWPMTVWLTPDRRPFYAGTYFPKEPHHGMASFRQIMGAISNAWSSDREGVEGQAEEFVTAISREPPVSDRPSRDGLERAARLLVGSFDPEFGGFGSAPKFPQQPVLEFLLRWRRIDRSVDHPLATTLTRMANGGIHDHLAGGFARYSVDREWLVPHFEKMLYDNAQLARIYLWAGMELDEPVFVDVARKTLDYLLSYMRHPRGAFFSAEDADSEGVEGRFYLWEPEDFERVLGPDAAAAMEFYGVTAAGNFEGSNILHVDPNRPSPANLDAINDALLRDRDKRVRPGLDDKIIASWNGLAIRAFAEAGAALGDSRYIGAAVAASGFLIEEMTVDGVLMRSWRDGRHSVPGFLDDHASAALGFYSAFQATGESRLFSAAESLVARLADFESDDGSFYTTTGDNGLVKRPRDITDSPLPSGNALAAEALLVSWLLTGQASRFERCIAALGAAGSFTDRYPSMVAHHLAVAASIEIGTRELAIVGPDRGAMTAAFWSAYRPEMVLAQSDHPDDTVPLLAGRPSLGGAATAYLCEGFVCDLPTTSPRDLAAALDRKPNS